MEAVLYLEGLAHGPLLGAGAHGAGGHAPRAPDVDGLVAHVAAHALLPQVEVDLGQRAAGHARVEEGVGHVEERALDVGDGVAVVAHCLAQAHFADLVELGLGEPDERVAALVPEPVALPQVPELDPDNAGEGWAHQATVQGSLGQAACNIIFYLEIFYKECCIGNISKNIFNRVLQSRINGQ